MQPLQILIRANHRLLSDSPSELLPAVSNSRCCPQTDINVGLDKWCRPPAFLAKFFPYLASLLIALSAVSDTFAATYYVDYVGGSDANAGTATGTAWKRCPGMNGFVGTYTHAAGDRFIFKGGVTWTSNCFPWTIGYSGSAGNVDTYTTDHAWYSGGEWSQPVFDANHTAPAGGMLNGISKSYLTFNDLSFINYATSGVAESKKAIDFLDGQGLSFTRCTITPYCWIALYIHHGTPGTYRSFNFSSNTVSHAASMLWFPTDAANCVRDGVTVAYNDLSDGSTQIGGGVHSDGFFHSFGSVDGVSSYITNLVIASNYAHGDWRRGFGVDGGVTAFIFFEDATSSEIYNNVFVPYPVQASMFESFMTVGTTTNHFQRIYNNTLLNPGTSSASGGIIVRHLGGGTVEIKNNIIDGFSYAMGVDKTNGTFAIDYNVFRSGNGQMWWGVNAGGDSQFKSYSVWQNTYGFDTHSILGADPLLVDVTGPAFDLSLQPTSPAVGAGANLSTHFTTDYLGNTRGSSWDIGAFAYGTNRPVVSLIATPPAITTGQSATLTWTSSNVTNLTISSVGAVSLNGSVNVAPSATTTYTIIATGSGGPATSTATVTVNTPAPAIVLTTPLNGTNFPTAPATVALTASVTANGTSITKVQFYKGAALLGEAVSSPYIFTWSNVTTGNFSLVARVVYGAGSTLDSTPVSISVGTPNSLVAAYSFDEGTGATVTDASGNGNTGAISGATWSTGKYGNALTFNGTSAMVTIPDSAALDLSTGMTLEAWVNPTVVSSAWRDVIYKGDEYYFLEATSTQGQVPSAGGTLGNTGIQAVYGAAALVPNTWTHLATTYDGTTLRLYVNGVQASSAVVTGNIPTSAYPLQIGGNNIYGQFFAGQIDDVRVYNKARTLAQIQSDMNTRVGAVPPSAPPTPPSNLSANP